MREDDEDGTQCLHDRQPFLNASRSTVLTDGGTARSTQRTLLVTSASEVRYEFTVTGSVERQATGDMPAATDSDITRDDAVTTVRSTVGDGDCDTYTISGNVTAFEPQYGDVSILADGEPVTPRELTAADGRDWPPSVGGGDGYPDAVAPAEASVTVSTADGLHTALADAASGETVYVAGDADIDAGTDTVRVPEGVTLASNRGIDAAPGGHIGTTTATWPLVSVADDARITGLRLGGPHDTFVEYDDEKAGRGVDAIGNGIEIDNCECFGFASAAVRCGGDTRVHHSYLHHNPMADAGTAVRCTDGHPVVEYNYMNYNRHAVTGTGDGGYTAAYNRVGAETLDYAIGVSRPGGTTVEIHHNTIAGPQAESDQRIAICGVPDDGVAIANNWFENAAESSESPDKNAPTAITNVDPNSRHDIDCSNNYYGSDEPSADIGHPR